MKKLITAIMLIMAVSAVMAQDNIYSFKAKNDKGEEISLEQYKGKLLLIVNTATRCGLFDDILSSIINIHAFGRGLA